MITIVKSWYKMVISFCRIVFQFLIRYIWYSFNVRNSIVIRYPFVSFFNIQVPSPISMFYSRFNLSFSDECKSLNFKPPSELTESIWWERKYKHCWIWAPNLLQWIWANLNIKESDNMYDHTYSANKIRNYVAKSRI